MLLFIDKYDLRDMTFQRKRDRIKNHLANWEKSRGLSCKRALKSKKSLIKCEFFSKILLYFGDSYV